MRQASRECVLPLQVWRFRAGHLVSGQEGVGRARRTPVGSPSSDVPNPPPTCFILPGASAGKTPPILPTEGLAPRTRQCPPCSVAMLSAIPQLAAPAMLPNGAGSPRQPQGRARQRRRPSAVSFTERRARNSRHAPRGRGARFHDTGTGSAGRRRRHCRSVKRQGLPDGRWQGRGQEVNQRRDGQWLCCSSG